jgi:uncharacterized protein (TIGR02145 family)
MELNNKNKTIMKKILLLMMCCPVILSAQNGVTVSNLAVEPGTVTFNVSWNDNQPEGFLWSDTVWVFVDYNKNGVMTRLPVTSATATAGTVTKIQSNDKGVWVVGNARSAGNFSATVQLLTATADLAGVCAYASNYPPVGEYTSSAKILFTGTPPYNLVLTSAESGTYTYSINAGYYKLYAGETILSFTDKTGAPGTIKCHAPGITGVAFADFNPCIGAPYGSTYTLTDDRDGKLYKIKYMPDDRYWMVQDLMFGDRCNKTTFTGSTSADQLGNINSSGTYYGDCRNQPVATGGYFYDWPAAMNKAGVFNANSTINCSGTLSGTTGTNPGACQGLCPSGWHLPTYAEFTYAASVWDNTYWTSATWWNSCPSCGCVQGNGAITDTNLGSLYWSSTIQNQLEIWIVLAQSTGLYLYENHKRYGGGLVRCLRNY